MFQFMLPRWGALKFQIFFLGSLYFNSHPHTGSTSYRVSTFQFTLSMRKHFCIYRLLIRLWCFNSRSHIGSTMSGVYKVLLTMFQFTLPYRERMDKKWRPWCSFEIVTKVGFNSRPSHGEQLYDRFRHTRVICFNSCSPYGSTFWGRPYSFYANVSIHAPTRRGAPILSAIW